MRENGPDFRPEGEEKSCICTVKENKSTPANETDILGFFGEVTDMKSLKQLSGQKVRQHDNHIV